MTTTTTSTTTTIAPFRGSLIKTLPTDSSRVFALAVLPNGDLVSGSANIKIWDVSTNTIKRTLTEHSQSILDLYVLKNGDLVSASMDRTIKVWV